MSRYGRLPSVFPPIRMVKAPPVCRICNQSEGPIRPIKVVATIYEHDQNIVPCGKFKGAASGLYLPNSIIEKDEVEKEDEDARSGRGRGRR
jgi:hypothetical protein